MGLINRLLSLMFINFVVFLYRFRCLWLTILLLLLMDFLVRLNWALFFQLSQLFVATVQFNLHSFSIIMPTCEWSFSISSSFAWSPTINFILLYLLLMLNGTNIFQFRCYFLYNVGYPWSNPFVLCLLVIISLPWILSLPLLLHSLALSVRSIFKSSSLLFLYPDPPLLLFSLWTILCFLII